MVSFGRHPIIRPWHMLLICLFSVTALASLLERPQVVLSKQNSPEIKGTAHQDALSCRNLLKTTRGTVVYTHGAESADPSSSGLRTCLLSGMAASFRPAIHTIMVEYPEKPGSATEHSVEQPLLDIIDVLPRLQRVRWPYHSLNSPARSTFIKWATAQKVSWDPQATFYNDAYFNHTEFIDCPGITMTENPGGLDDKISDPMGHIYKTLTSCSDIQSLDLTISYGCIIDEWTQTARSFNWNVGDRFPNLQNLTLRRYEWSDDENGNATDGWVDGMNWSRLERLAIEDPSTEFLELFTGKLSNLKAFERLPMRGLYYGDSSSCQFGDDWTLLQTRYHNFITSLNKLEELSLSGLGKLLDMPFLSAKVGKGLKRLAIHDFERDCIGTTNNYTWTRPTLTAHEINTIRPRLPKLEHLAIDVYRSGTWPIDIFKAIANFPRLKTLDLHFNLEDPHRWIRIEYCHEKEKDLDMVYCRKNPPMKPQLNASSAKEIWQKFSSLRTAQSLPNLHALTLHTGDFQRHPGVTHRPQPGPVSYQCVEDASGLATCEWRSSEWHVY